jgi:hypothetical protein
MTLDELKAYSDLVEIASPRFECKIDMTLLEEEARVFLVDAGLLQPEQAWPWLWCLRPEVWPAFSPCSAPAGGDPPGNSMGSFKAAGCRSCGPAIAAPKKYKRRRSRGGA